MKVLILTPLFPPDIGDPATYVKELATRMTMHETSLLIYGHLPEAVSGVGITAIDKRQWLPKRLVAYTIALFNLSKKADLIIINNAPSTELPALFVSFFVSKKMILCESDSLAIIAVQGGFYKIIHSLLKRRCNTIIVLPYEGLYKKPEVLPFSTTDEKTLATREAWWNNHLKELTIV